jgi:hypothetical protein
MVTAKTDWTTAHCNGIDTELFFLSGKHQIAKAKRFCVGCPVQIECLEMAIDEEFGVYGGLSAAERGALRSA